MKPDSEVKGKELLGSATLKQRRLRGASEHWDLAVKLLSLTCARNIKVFGIVCFRTGLHSFVCDNETVLDITYRYLFERIDAYMKREFPSRFAKLVFDNRDYRTDEKNARAITNFFSRSRLGLGYDSLIRVPFFAVSQGHNYGLQLADLVTTVIALYFQGKRDYAPLWELLKPMLYRYELGGQRISSLKIIRDRQTP